MTEGKQYSRRHRTSAEKTRNALFNATYLCFASSENAHIDPMASVARISPRLFPFNTRTFFHMDSFDMGPLDDKLFDVRLSNTESFNAALSYELRPVREAVCAEKVHRGGFPGFVV